MTDRGYISRTVDRLKDSTARWDDAFDRMRSMNFVFEDLEKELGYERAMDIYQRAYRALEGESNG